jgi:geranylgeranyl diphosphate synthase type I
MNPPATSETLAPEMLEALERDLRVAATFQGASACPQMAEMISYHFGWSGEASPRRGKRIRPLLTLLTCASAGADWHAALPVASSVELIHNFSLVHDDIQDQSDERRGRPTVWKLWGVAQALNTGDALLVLGRLSTYRLLNQGLPASRVQENQRLLDQACLDLTRGQHLDLAFESRKDVTTAEYFAMIEGKTAALIAAAAACGACVAGAADETAQAYWRYGRHLGLAFQVLDDILGTWGEPDVTGKPAGDDLRSRKKTLPALIGLERSAEFARLWASPPSEREDVRRMTALLEEAGALTETQRQAHHHTGLALAELESAAPASQAGAELRQLTLQLLQRDR